MSDVHNVKITRDTERWEFEIAAEIPAEALAHFRSHVLKDMAKDAEIKGFRKGHVPEDALVRHVGEAAIQRATAEDAVKHVIPELLAKEKANIVEAPQVAIETLEAGKPIKFTARAPLAPEVTLPDYAKIASGLNKKREGVTISDDEHKETLMHFRRERARIDKIESGTAPDKAGEEARALEEKDLPELDDAFIKTIGYDTMDVFTEKLREHLKNEKEMRAQSEHRAKILDALVEKADIKMPAMMREYELDDMEGRFTDDLARMGKTLENYFAEAKKTREELRKEWGEAATKRAHIRLILSNIAQKEKIEASEETLAKEIEIAKKHYPQSSPDTLRAHIAHALRNDAVLEWLEKLS